MSRDMDVQGIFRAEAMAMIEQKISSMVRRAVVDAGAVEGKMVVIGTINVQINYASGGGAKVEVSNS